MIEKESFYRSWRPADGDHLPDLGVWGRNEVFELVQYLRGGTGRQDDPVAPDAYDFRYRLAPSIITRGEAEMLGLSDPRFAIRLLISRREEDSPLGIVNLRRLARLKEQAGTWARVRGTSERSAYRYVWHKPLRKASCVADSILAPPRDRLPEADWKLLTMPRRAVLHYGEALSFPGVPYMKHVNFLGGGMCAQAACFMATMLSYEHARSVFSIPEITILAHNRQDEEGEYTVDLGGLQPSAVVNYFNSKHVGLHASWQRFDYAFCDGDWTPNAECQGLLRRAFEGYLCSGFPVVLCVDMDRLNGRGIKSIPCKSNVYDDNHLRVPQLLDNNHITPRNMSHMVTAVGMKREGDKIVFNDPARSAFLTMSVQNFVAASFYGERSDGLRSKWGLCDPQFISVTPRNARLPLLTEMRWQWGKTREIYSGLLDMSGDAQLGGQEPLSTPDHSVFRLLRPRDLLRQVERVDSRFHGLSREDALGLRQWLASDIALGPDYWLWMEDRLGTILLWDAVKEPPRYRCGQAVDFGHHLLGYGVRCGQTRRWKRWPNWTCEQLVDTEPEPSSGSFHDCVRLSANEPEIGLSLITSFCLDGMSKALERWPASDILCDLYAFMRSDGDEGGVLGDLSIWKCLRMRDLPRLVSFWSFFCCRTIASLFERVKIDRHRGVWTDPKWAREPLNAPDVNICAWLARRCDERKYISSVAGQIGEVLTSKNVRCIALSSFFPEISTSDRAVAEQALLFLVRLASELNKRQFAAVRVIELVCGGRIDHVVMSERLERDGKPERVFHARVTALETVHKWLVSALASRVVAEAREAGIRLALELEPGLLFGVSHLSDVERVKDLIDKHGVTDTVGFNYDTAHWMLAGIKVSSSGNASGACRFPAHGVARRQPVSIFPRLFGAHLSHSGLGHFGDLVPRKSDNRQHRVHLDFLRSAYSHSGRIEDCHVSLELEAARSVDYMKHGIRRIRALLRR